MAYKELFHDERVLEAATVTKLTRNLFLAAVVPLLSYLHFRGTEQPGSSRRLDISKLFPIFVLGFIGMAILRSVGDVAWNSTAWKSLTNQIGDVWGSRYLLGSAMAAVGLGTGFSVFKGVGLKPFAVGLIGALVVGLMGLAMALSLGAAIHF
jgi:uncharacterized membrane protein YadS